MSTSYRRVPVDESVTAGNTTDRGNSSSNNGNSIVNSSNSNGRTRTRTRSERLVDKLVALVWVSVAAGVAYWSNFFSVILQFHVHNNASVPGDKESYQVNRPMLQIAAVGVGILLVLTLYLTLYLPKVVGVTDSSAWEVYCPRVIPTMAIVAFLTLLALIRATWPVWGFLAPLIIIIEGLGALFALHFIPSLAG